MKRLALFLATCVAVVSAVGLWAQEADSVVTAINPPAASQPVPRLIMLSGVVKDLTGKPLTGPVDLNFAIYKEQTDAAPLWQESQTLNVDEQGHYSALLGAMQPEGLPVDLFTSGEARWLGVSVGKLPEQPRVLLVSVPYALKANDAEMLGGKPASAYALAPAAESGTSQGLGTAGATGPRGAATPDVAAPGKPTSGPKPNLAGTGTQNYIPLWTNSTGTLGNSVIYQSSGLVGIGTTTPGGKLDVAGSVGHFQVDTSGAQFRFSRGSANYFLASTAGGYFDFVVNGLTPSDATASLKLAVNGTAAFMAGNVGIGTLTPAQKLDVTGNIHTSGNVAATGSVTAASFTGSGAGLTTLNASNLASGTVPSAQLSGTYSNAVTFSSASNSFTGNGSGLTSVNATTLGGLTAGAFATLGANTLTATQTISSGDLSLPQTTGASTGVINLGGSPFLHACCSAGQHNTFVGPNAGNFTTTGPANTASGYRALYSNTTGSYNTATGNGVLFLNTTGSDNTASGWQALYSNTTGYANTASGIQALYSNTAGGNNTAVGVSALASNCSGVSSGCLGNYNTAVGSNAGVTGTDAYANITGANNTFLGANSGPGTSTQLNNAAAIGANAVVSASNALVLGSINGVNGATAGVNVGIGTATPAHVLDVVGDIHASSNITTGGVFTGNGSGLTNVSASTAIGLSCTGCVGNPQLGINYAASATQGGPATNALLLNGLAASSFQAAGSYAVTNGPNSFTGTQTVSSGMLGIGTTAPVSPLNVAGTTGLTWIGGGNNLGLATFGTPGTGGSLYVNTTSGSSTYQSGLGIDGTYGTPPLQSVIDLKALGVDSGGGYGSQLAFWTTNGTALNRQMTLDMNGNLGIGTTTPAAKLEVNGTAKFDGVVTFASGQTFPGAGGGTVTSVGTGAGLTGGPITTSGTISIPSGGVSNSMLANPSLNINTNSGLTGGGQVYLGESLTLGMVANVCSPGMAVTAIPGPGCQPFAGTGPNYFSGPQTISISGGNGLFVSDTGGGVAIQAYSGAAANSGVAALFVNSNGGTILNASDGNHTILSADTNGVKIRRTTMTIGNDPTNATVLYDLATVSQSTGTAKLAGPGYSGGFGAVGIVVADAGTASNYPESIVATAGETQCNFDNTAVNFHFFQVSPTTAGLCHDAGPNYPVVGQVLGVVIDTTQSPPAVSLFGLEAGVETGVIATNANCSASGSPAVCGAAGAGSVAILASASSVVVDTTAVTANSQIMLQEDSSLGTKLGVTCNTTAGRTYMVTGRTAGTSFTIGASSAPATNPACLSYTIVN